MGRLFGTDGVRGVANKDLTADLAFKIGRAGAYVLSQSGQCAEKGQKPKILVGKDTRISGDMLEAALAAGICSVGAEVVMLGVVPTPAVAHLVGKYGADAGVVISASHNSFEYNGIKFFNAKGYKLSDAVEAQIEAIILDGIGEPEDMPTHADIGRCSVLGTAADDYVAHAKSVIDCDLSGIHIALDCANGANSGIAPAAMESLGAAVTAFYTEPNGININAGCGSTHVGKLAEYIKQNQGIDIGIAFDGDADRMLAVDENGEPVNGDEIMMIIGAYLKSQGRLKKDAIAATVMSNLGFFIAAKAEGINAIQTAVGDRYVLEAMLEHGYSLGGEDSGHIIMLDYNTTGDGLVSALMLMSIIKNTGKKLSELKSIVKILPQVLVNAKVSNEGKAKLSTNSAIQQEIAKVEVELAGNGRVLIRPSGTEPVVRVMIEGNDKTIIEARARMLADMIENAI